MTALATYTFLPWLRQGLARSIIESETTANPALRASVDVQVTLRSEGVSAAVPDEPIDRVVRLLGPGDILGVDPSAIIKTDPRAFITNHEPNYLAAIDFYDEDFPWRYTPARADASRHRQRPWVALVVLEESEFTDGNAHGKPLPFINLPDLTKLPPIAELWAWAHVHVNRNLGTSETVIVNDDDATIVAKLGATLAENADLAYARLLSPRHLRPNTPYHAFLVPSFESGRVAGLGLDLTKVDDAMRGAWEDHPQRASLSPTSFPYYYRWYFRTGDAVDFESLVRLLTPRAMDPRVGTRDLDVQRPAVNLAGIAGPDADGVLRLGGALKIPDSSLDDAQRAEADRFERWDEPRPHPFQRDLAAYINLADDYATTTPADAHGAVDVPASVGRLPDGSVDPDPLITPPLYGRWHALTARLLAERDGTPVANPDNWVHQLNLDPRHRVAAGLGTQVVRDQQEAFVEAAWEQVGQVLEANRRIRSAQLALAVSQAWFARSLAPMSAERLFAVAAPMFGRVVTRGTTLKRQLAMSPIPTAMTGTALRRVVRPTGRLVGKLSVGRKPEAVSAGVLSRLNAGTLATAPPAVVPASVATVRRASEALLPHGVPPWLVDFVRARRHLPLELLVLFLLSAPFVGTFAVPAGFIARALVRRLRDRIVAADALLPERQTAASVDTLPARADFKVQRFGAKLSVPPPGRDSADAVRFKTALRTELSRSEQASAATRRPARVPLAVPAVAKELLAAVAPQRTIPARLGKTIRLPSRIQGALGSSDVVEVMAYPRIEEPMYRPLVKLGSELFLPNVGLIPQNSISLLETNQRFIESYLVGVNHEFARELLWREYPTDQRGSYFRQFWDVSGYKDDAALDPDVLREKLYDIPKLHYWSKTSALGDHDNRQPPGSPPRDEAVLAIRGELLKRYPTAVIYAHRAAWQLTNGQIDKSKIRVLAPLTPAEEADPPRGKVKTPLYEARIDPDITFFGFDLTVPQAKGDPGVDDPGWFFVIKERPGEPRFGLDLERDPSAPINTWSDLAWGDVDTEQDVLRIRSGMRSYTLTTPPPSSEGPEELAQHQEDRQVRWNDQTDAADVAYVLYQLPVLVAVHASEMLP